MKFLELSQGQVSLIDDEDYEYLSQWKWHSHWNEGTKSFYAVRNEGKGIFRRLVWVHREIMHTPKGSVCDHENHDTLNNQKYNLRNVTYSQNNMNQRLRRDSNLKEKGISKHGKGFRVQIGINGKKIFRKTYSSIEDAKLARDEFYRIYHGEFSYLPEKLSK